MSPTKQRQKKSAAVPRQRSGKGRGAETRKSARKNAQQTTQRTSQQRSGMTLPVVHATIPRPHVDLPPMDSKRGRVLWLGGLGTLAVIGVLDWPVAVVVAAGAWVAEERARERLQTDMAATAT
jgi:hypothetical protein